ncbi:hypothetical protein A2U01_0007203 [Trifolium medium]|uniref:Uncharacterized protein n=1 Tax=Trifolium medium TaxID=97028 RepID=A0A392MFR3_9FABA|nr:hypothetical protein [Trifolium medium]
MRLVRVSLFVFEIIRSWMVVCAVLGILLTLKYRLGQVLARLVVTLSVTAVLGRFQAAVVKFHVVMMLQMFLPESVGLSWRFSFLNLFLHFSALSVLAGRCALALFIERFSRPGFILLSLGCPRKLPGQGCSPYLPSRSSLGVDGIRAEYSGYVMMGHGCYDDQGKYFVRGTSGVLVIIEA